MAKSSSPAAGQDKFILRLPDGMRAELKELAAEHNRSLNAEIVAHLEDYQQMDVRLYETINMNKTLNAEVDRLYGVQRQFRAIKSRFYDENDEPKSLISVPDDLLDRIQQAAKRNHRTVDGEVVATLEEAYPPRSWPAPNLDISYLQWYSDDWHYVEAETWARFRSGEPSPEITDKMTEKSNNYLVVAVFDDAGMLCNIIVHNYIYKDGKVRSPAFDYLSPDEIDEYNRFMTALSATKEDEARLRELRNKMDPAFDLPSESVPALRAILASRSPKDVVDNVLVSRGILNPSAV